MKTSSTEQSLDNPSSTFACVISPGRPSHRGNEFSSVFECCDVNEASPESEFEFVIKCINIAGTRHQGHSRILHPYETPFLPNLTLNDQHDATQQSLAEAHRPSSSRGRKYRAIAGVNPVSQWSLVRLMISYPLLGELSCSLVSAVS